MIEITKTPNADSRSSQGEMTKEKLRPATEEHIKHVQAGMKFFMELLQEAGKQHDHTKIKKFDEFFTALTSGDMKGSSWYKDHIKDERHHLIAHVPEDVTLIDVFEHLVDCVMAGMSRSGEIYDIELPDYVLQKAHKNTVELLKKNVKVVKSDDIMDSSIT